MIQAKKTGAVILLGVLLFTQPLYANKIKDLVIAPAMELLGSAYQLGAEGPSRFDCSGFVRYLYKAYAPSLPRISRDMARQGRAVARGSVKPGDLMFFATGSSSKRVTHVAVYIGQDSLLHAISNGPSRGVSMTRLSSRYWNSRYHSARRVLPDSYYRDGGGRELSQQNFARGVYSGQADQGEPQGEGEILLSNGDRYSGDFTDGFPQGEGRYRWKDGRVYEGSFEHGLLHRRGKIRFADGSVLSGVWNRGRLVSVLEKSGGRSAALRIGSHLETYYQVEDSPWDRFSGAVEGDYALWREAENDSFEAWKRENQPQR